MLRYVGLGIISLVFAAGPAVAQQQPDAQQSRAAAPPSGTPTNPDLTVATVKMQGGQRVSKLIGSPVYNAQNQKVGSVDDLIMKDGNRIVMTVVSVGGFLGIGNKLVAVPYEQMQVQTDKDGMKIELPDATKDALNAMPTFTYGG